MGIDDYTYIRNMLHVLVYKHICMHAYIYYYMHTHTHTHTHTHKHTHTQVSSKIGNPVYAL